MPRIIMIIDVADEDPTLVDPHNVAEDIVDIYDENRSHVVESYDVTFVSAEWED